MSAFSYVEVSNVVSFVSFVLFGWPFEFLKGNNN